MDVHLMITATGAYALVVYGYEFIVAERIYDLVRTGQAVAWVNQAGELQVEEFAV